MAQLPAKTQPIRLLALGDSYTIGESVSEKDRWPTQLAARLSDRGYIMEEVRIIATTGWRTDELKRAIGSSGVDNNYDLVSLLIGVNNQYQGKPVEEYASQFEELLGIAVQHAQGDKKKVFVLSIPDYGYTPFGKERQKQISSGIDAFNRVNKNICERWGITYFDITDISRKGLEDPELVAADGLHPSGKMYTLWVSTVLAGL
ncbi:MAG TPA: SGNH/GDSL hydrolase family protein [Chryseosolibacter sp.]|nr:SGNH/GDSL hydrolase family protein [Chryseosolibacter sp.]